MLIQSVMIEINGIKRPFHFRSDSIGDKSVIHQMFLSKDYDVLKRWAQGKSLIDYYEKQTREFKVLIVDLGANIGASTVFFSLSYPKSHVYCVEPESTNWHLQCLNTKGLDCTNYLGASSHHDGTVSLYDPGRSDYGFMTTKDGDPDTNRIGDVPTISMNSILNSIEAKDKIPFILKIDIEGAESELFQEDCGWLVKFPCIIIELHDWMLPFKGSSKNFLTAVARSDFDVIYHGENIFLFNANILNKLESLSID